MPEMIHDVLSWATNVETPALEQAHRTAALPFVVKPLALMPDAHHGKGSTVGSVIATEGAIIPAAVGVDIGCGMIAVRTELTSHDLPDNLDAVHAAIAAEVPAGVAKQHTDLPDRARRGYAAVMDKRAVVMTTKQDQTALAQMGTLGSGNHFVEICLDESDRVWVVLHSGSRGIGNQLASAHIEKAKGLMRQWFLQIDDPDLAYLPEGTREWSDYIRDLLWAQEYAYQNRQTMLDAVLTAFAATLRTDPFGAEIEIINCHHNFTQKEHHRGRDLWITRKGAIKAGEGDRGVIPGSMGTRSYIVTGLGNPASYCSCSHGAGRRLSRTAARKTLSVDSLRQAMEGKTWNAQQAEQLLDEHPDSYKDIDEVMANQTDLVRVDHTLHQILNYKGV